MSEVIEKKPTPQMKWNQANPLARWAHRALHSALRSGLLVKQPCEICGAEDAEFHHPDYRKPIDGQWLCRLHHRRLHARQRKHGRAAHDA